MKSSKAILPSLCLLATALFASSVLGAAQPTEPPIFDPSFRGASISVYIQGVPWPTTYQWYRGTATNPKKYKIPAPEGIQRELILKPPYVAGLYVCEATNAAGTSTSNPTKVSVTKTPSAPNAAITLKQP